MVIQITSKPIPCHDEDAVRMNAVIDGVGDHLIKQKPDGSLWMDHMYLGEGGTTLEYIPVPKEAEVRPFDERTFYADHNFSSDHLVAYDINHEQDFLLVGDKDVHLFSCDEGNGFDNDLRETFWTEKDGYSDVSATYHKDEPVVHLDVFDHSHPDGRSYLLIPADQAANAYDSKKYHDKIVNSLNHEAAVDFFMDAEALPLVDYDPISAGIVDGAIMACRNVRGTNPHDGWMEKNVAQRLQNFVKEDFYDFLDELRDDETVPSPEEYPFDACNSLAFEMPNYIAGMQKSKETQLSRGIEMALKEPNYVKRHEMLDGFFRGERKTIKALKEAGKASIR